MMAGEPGVRRVCRAGGAEQPPILPVMKRIRFLLTAIVCLGLQAAVFAADQTDAAKAARDATRDKLRETLDAATAEGLNVTFRQRPEQPYRFAGVMETGLENAQSLEIIVDVTASDTIGFRVYPHYQGGYINIDKAPDGQGLMRRLLAFNGTNFMFWGVDDTNDVFSGYTITLESGYPKEAVRVVLASIHNTDGFVGKLRPFLDSARSSAKH